MWTQHTNSFGMAYDNAGEGVSDYEIQKFNYK